MGLIAPPISQGILRIKELGNLFILLFVRFVIAGIFGTLIGLFVVAKFLTCIKKSSAKFAKLLRYNQGEMSLYLHVCV